MEKKSLHVFLQSTMINHGGGVESWLDYFLRENIDFNYYSEIFIYGFENATDYKDLVGKYEGMSKIKFKTVPIISNRPGMGSINMFSFYKNHAKEFSKNVKYLDHVIFIGTIIFAPFLLLIKKIIKQKKIFLITWIRSNSLGEMRASGSKFLVVAPLFERYVLNKSSRIITNGHDTFKLYSINYPQFKKKIRCVPNAVDVEKFIDIPIEFKNTTIKVAYLGRYVKAKGFDNFIEAIQLFSQKYPGLSKKIKFLSFGHGEIKVPSTFMKDKGKYTPENLKTILEEIDVVVFLNSSKYSGGLSHALLEVMASGKLIIAWDNEVHNQVLTNENSFLIEEDNISSLVEAFVSLSETKGENNLLQKRNNVRMLSKQYSTKQHFKNYLDAIT